MLNFLRRFGVFLPAALLTAAFSQPEIQQRVARSPLLAQASQALHLSSVAQANQPNWASVEQDIITEHNRLRQNPQSYIPVLEAYLARMDANGNIPNGCGPNCTLQTQEGAAAVEEAIAFLQAQPPVGPLEYSSQVAEAAKVHATDQQDGAVGHTGSDGSGPSQRIDRTGLENFGTGENIAYGLTTGQDVIMGLLIDDGVADRGHRTNLFQPDWTAAGAGCGPHATIRTVCVINYAKLPQETAGNSQLQVTNGGDVSLLSLKVAGEDILGGTLAPGQSRNLLLSEEQACQVNLEIQLGGNYLPFTWDNLNVCDAEMKIDEENHFMVSY